MKKSHIIKNVDTIDFNLIRTFIAVFEERSATLAAQRLKLTQSAISVALRKLRNLYQDVLFVRTGRGLNPTLFAQQLYPLLKESIDRVAASLSLHDDQAILYSGRIITVGLSDDFEAALGPKLVELARNVPNCTRLHFRQTNASVVGEMLMSRSIDVAISSGGFWQEGITFTALGEGTYGCLLDPEIFGDIDELTLEMLLNHDHIMVSRSGFFGVVDDVLANIGYRRRVRVSTSHFCALPILLTGSNCISILPRHAARAIATKSRLKYFPCPVEFPSFGVGIAWRNFSRTDRVLSKLITVFSKSLENFEF